MRYFVEVHVPGAQAERYVVSRGSGTMGSGSDDVVFLPSSTGAGVGIFEVDVSAAGVVFACTAQTHVPFNYQGVEATRVQVPWGGDIYFGSTRISVVEEKTAESGRSPILPVAGFIAVSLLVAALVPLSGVGSRPTEPARPEFGAATGRCEAKEPTSAGRMAREASARAVGKLERYPFVRKEGPEALRLLGEQAACLVVAGDLERAQEVEGERRRHAQRVGVDFAALRVTLERALEGGRASEARTAAGALQSLLSKEQDETAREYCKWLKSVQERSLGGF